MPRNYVKKGYRKKRSLNMDGDAAEMKVDKDAARNFKYHEFAKEFVNNGCSPSMAYAVVFQQPPGNCHNKAKTLVNKPFMVDLIRAYFVGDHEAKPTKEWAVTEWRKQVESNVLDYIDDDGGFLSVAELRKLPAYAQRAIKSINVTTTERVVKLDGRSVMKDGLPMVTKTQRVTIQLIDKQKALNDLAKAEKWIETHMNVTLSAPIGADLLIQAQIDRQKRLTITDPKVIEGKSERVNDDQDG